MNWAGILFVTSMALLWVAAIVVGMVSECKMDRRCDGTDGQ